MLMIIRRHVRSLKGPNNRQTLAITVFVNLSNSDTMCGYPFQFPNNSDQVYDDGDDDCDAGVFVTIP